MKVETGFLRVLLKRMPAKTTTSICYYKYSSNFIFILDVCAHYLLHTDKFAKIFATTEKRSKVALSVALFFGEHASKYFEFFPSFDKQKIAQFGAQITIDSIFGHSNFWVFRKRMRTHTGKTSTLAWHFISLSKKLMTESA